MENLKNFLKNFENFLFKQNISNIFFKNIEFRKFYEKIGNLENFL